MVLVTTVTYHNKYRLIIVGVEKHTYISASVSIEINADGMICRKLLLENILKC